jgi:hypothetical protein
LAKKKKKKRKPGAQKPSYAKGKPVSETTKKKAGTSARGSATKAGAGGRQQSGAAQQRESWNVIRRGTLEAKVMWALFALIVLAAFMRYPLSYAEAEAQYKSELKQYKTQLAKWEKDNPTKEEQKKNAEQKPEKPKEPTSNLVLFSVLFGALQSGIFAFLGLNIIRRTDFGTPVLDGTFSGEGIRLPDLTPFVTWSLPAALLVLVPLYGNARISSELVNSVVKTTEPQAASFPLWKQVLGSVNDGLFYVVLFVMVSVTACFWILNRYRAQVKVEPHWAGIAAAFVLTFGFILLNVWSGSRQSAADVVMSTLIFYSLALAAPVLILGYVFWKKGLEYSLLAGVVGFSLYPIMASFVIK